MNNMISPQGLIIALCLLIVVAIIGSVLTPDKATEILGFSGLIATSLMSILVQVYTGKKQKEELQDIKVMGERNHVLLNSNMGIQLKSNAELSRWKADQTKNVEHVKAAEEAELMYKEHMKKQNSLDLMDSIAVGLK